MWKMTLLAPSGMNSSLKKSLRHVGDRLHEAERADAIGSGARLHVPGHLALGVDHVADHAQHHVAG